MFEPPEGQNFFVSYGWAPKDLQGNVGRGGENLTGRRKNCSLCCLNQKGFQGITPRPSLPVQKKPLRYC